MRDDKKNFKITFLSYHQIHSISGKMVISNFRINNSRIRMCKLFSLAIVHSVPRGGGNSCELELNNVNRSVGT